MEEDIKILEEFIEYSQEMINDMEYERPVDVTISQNEIQTLEHLIKVYKEKEYLYNKALSDLVQAEHENKELKEKIRSYEDEIQEQAKDLMFCEETIRDEYISVSLVKEKIEWLEVNILDNEYASDNDKDIAEYQVQVLQKLLEKR